jgi:hypothetical protein
VHAVRALDTGNLENVGALGARFGVSPRTSERRVLDGTGLSPGTLRKALRFRARFGCWIRRRREPGARLRTRRDISTRRT